MESAAKYDTAGRSLVFLAFALSAFMVFAGLGKLSLMKPDEERNAEVAREMEQSGSWLIPTYNGLPYLDKPAFFFKVVGLCFSVFGESSAAARLPSAVFGFALLVMLFRFCRGAYDARTAALAVMIVGTSPLYVAFCRLVIFDMVLSFFLCGAIFAGYIAEEKQGQSRSRWYLVGAISSAFATLVKGPVGFILPVLVLGVFNGVDGRRDAWKRLLAPWNVVAFFVVTLPWFFGVTYHYHDFAYYGIIEESFRRYTTPAFQRTGPIYYYLPWILGGCFAWSVLLPESIVAAWRSRSRWARADRLFIIWSIVMLVFFSISKSKRADYILTVIVALGALTARVFAVAIRGGNRRATAIVSRGTIGLAVASALGAGVLAAVALRPDEIPWLASAGSKRFAWHEPTYWLAAGALAAVALMAGAACVRGNMRLAFATFVLLPCVAVVVCADGLARYAEAKSTHALASRIPALPPQAEIVCLECFPTGLPFYLKRCVTVVSDDGRELTSNYIMFMLKRTKPWPSPLVPATDFDRWLKGQGRSVYLIAQENGRERLDALAAGVGVASTELAPGWWAALLPAPKGP
ncbi:MAG: glycosyltransferase family 39 protein [Verrucomicrobiia bacterium]|jgi:4-amino-4-deoxy-L-arabinose transferase-like glycosyltransferase